MRKKLLAAIIASELPKPCITLDLFKSEDRLRAYGGMRCPGRVTMRMSYQDFHEAAHATARNKKALVWVDGAGFLANSPSVHTWKPATPEQIMEIKNLFDKADK